ncbi:MAG: HPP family protein [Patescibacteria group bacterium]
MQVKDYMTTDFCHGSPDTLFEDIFRCWQSSDQHIFLVLDGKRKILGLVTFYDLIKRFIPFYLQLDEMRSDIEFSELLSSKTVEKCMNLRADAVMAKKVVTVQENDNILKAMSEMFSFEFDYIPVTDSNGTCTGIITRAVIEEKVMQMIQEKQT